MQRLLPLIQGISQGEMDHCRPELELTLHVHPEEESRLSRSCRAPHWEGGEAHGDTGSRQMSEALSVKDGFGAHLLRSTLSSRDRSTCLQDL